VIGSIEFVGLGAIVRDERGSQPEHFSRWIWGDGQKWTSHDKIMLGLRAADVFCISSLDDNFPTTVLESIACGTPVVGFQVGGIPEQVTEDCGILVEPRDAQGLGKAITQLLQDDVLREKMSKNCRARAVAEYSNSKFRDRYVSLYHEIVGENGL